MSIPNNPATVRPVSSDLRQFIDKLDKSGLTSQIHAEKNNEGKVIFLRASVTNKNAGKVVEHLKLTTQRQLARDEIKRMLQDSGITLTDDIKKAMPSLKRGGDANTLKVLLQEAVSKQDAAVIQASTVLANSKNVAASKVAMEIDHTNPNEVKAGFKRELEATNFQKDKVGTFLRENSNTAKALAKVFNASFTPISNNCAQITADATIKSLSEKKDTDQAMTAGYQALLGSLSSIKLPESFETMCVDMAKEIDKSAAEAVKKEPGRATEIKQVADTFKNMIVATLFLRVFTTQITVTLSKSQQKITDTAKASGVELKSTTLLQRLAPPFLALINLAKDTAKVTGTGVSVYDDHPELRKFVSDKSLNNLNNFTAYHQLNAQIQANNSTADN
jgi:hypothetical protein